MTRASRLSGTHYDAVVVGSGPNGLAAAVALAGAGLGVLVVEAQPAAGGGMRSGPLTVPGFMHDVCSSVHPLGIASPFLRALELEKHGLTWIHPVAPLAHVMADGQAVTLSGGISDLTQLFFRPVARVDPYSTPAKDVFVCSSATPPGGGVHGMCGYWGRHQRTDTRLRNGSLGLEQRRNPMDTRQRIAISDMVSERTPRPLMGPLLTFDLPSEVNSLRAEDVWRAHGHNARTLIKHSEFRLVLVALQAGKHVHEHETPVRLTIQVLDGRARVHVPTENVELTAGQLLALDRHLNYGIEALEESNILLWVGWSKD